VKERALQAMPQQLTPYRIKTEAKLTEIECVQVVVEGRIGGVVPGVALMLADSDPMDGFEFGQLEMQLQGLLVHPLMLAVFLVHSLLDPLPFAYLLCLDLFPCEILQGFSGDPLIVPSIKRLVMDVVLVAVIVLLLLRGVVYIGTGVLLARRQLRMRALYHLLTVSM
jgi:hypothetical protein